MGCQGSWSAPHGVKIIPRAEGLRNLYDGGHIHAQKPLTRGKQDIPCQYCQHMFDPRTTRAEKKKKLWGETGELRFAWLSPARPSWLVLNEPAQVPHLIERARKAPKVAGDACFLHLMGSEASQFQPDAGSPVALAHSGARLGRRLPRYVAVSRRAAPLAGCPSTSDCPAPVRRPCGRPTTPGKQKSRLARSFRTFKGSAL